MNVQNFTSIDFLLEKKIVQPISSSVIESAPIAHHASEVGPIHEVVEHTIKDEEVSPHIEVRPEKIEIPPELQKVGVQESTQPLVFPSYQTIKLPIPDEKIYTGSHAPIYSSLRWLSMLCIYILHQGHAQLKNLHGKVQRVVKR